MNMKISTAACPAAVAQVCHLLSRGFLIRMACEFLMTPNSRAAEPTAIRRYGAGQLCATNRRRGFLQLDLVVGLAILSIAIVPVGYAFTRERQVLKIEYQRAVINELVDGEMEILAAGAAKNLADGAQNFSVASRATDNLPPGHFQFTKTGSHLKLEWLPDEKRGVSAVVREAVLK